MFLEVDMIRIQSETRHKSLAQTPFMNPMVLTSAVCKNEYLEYGISHEFWDSAYESCITWI